MVHVVDVKSNRIKANNIQIFFLRNYYRNNLKVKRWLYNAHTNYRKITKVQFIDKVKMSLSLDNNKDGEPSVSYRAVDETEVDVSKHDKLEIKISNLITEREKMVTKIVTIDEHIFNSEVSMLKSKHELLNSIVDKIYCKECTQIENPRLRNKYFLHQIHGEILHDKPKHLLCIFGLFKRLEDIALKGLMDEECTDNKEMHRCTTCDQIFERDICKKLLITKILDIIINENKKEGLECSVDSCCQKCQIFIESFLHSQVSNPETMQPHPSIFDRKESNSRNLFRADSKKSQFLSNKLSEVNSYNPFEEDMLEENVFDEIDYASTSTDNNMDKIQNKSKKDSKVISKMEDEINNLKLTISSLGIKLNEHALELKQQKIQILSHQQQKTENLTIELEPNMSNVVLTTPYCIGKHINLTSFSAKPEEDPYVLMRKWELELKKCGIPSEDWTFFVSRAFEGIACGWWSAQGCSDELTWEEFTKLFVKSFGRKELRRWLTFAGNLCLAAENEPIGTYINTRYKIVLRALGQNKTFALGLLEKHLNSKLEKQLIINSFEDFYFLIVAEQALNFHETKVLFHHILAEIRDDESYWNKQ